MKQVYYAVQVTWDCGEATEEDWLAKPLEGYITLLNDGVGCSINLKMKISKNELIYSFVII